MKKSVLKKAICILLAVAMNLSAVQILVFAISSYENGNYIFNHGDASKVTIYAGTDVVAQTKTNATKFGDAVSLTATKIQGSGWAQIPAAVPSGYNYSPSNGIAFYARFPETVSATNFTIRLIDKAWSTWYQIGTNVNLTLADTDGKKSSISQVLPFENMQGYEGYVFVPFEMLNSGSSAVVDKTKLNPENWNIEISYYFNNEDCINKEYCFDQIGFYGDMDEYIKMSNSELLNANFVFNHGDSIGVNVAGGDQISVEKALNVSRFGDALNIKPTTTGAAGWAQIPATVADKRFDYNATKGIAMYVKLPKGGANTNLTLRLIKKNWSNDWYTIGINKELTFVTINGNKTTKTTKTQNLPFENMQGFEGFVFIPYEALTDGSAPQVDKAALNGSDWTVEISLYYNDASCVGLDYYFDEIGYYNSVDDYAADLIKDSLKGNTVFNSGDAAGVKIAAGNDVKVSSAQRVTKYGDAICLQPTAVHGGGWAQIPAAAAEDFDYSASKGIGMYTKFPAELEGSGLTLRIINEGWSKWFTLELDRPIILVSNDGKVTMTTYSTSNIAGFEGFMFIPYASVAHPNEVIDPAIFKTDKWNIEVGFYAGNQENVGINCYFDEIGYYSNIYVYMGIPAVHKSANYIFNNGESADVTIYGGRDIKVSTAEKLSWCGNALNINPTKVMGGGWAQVPAKIADAGFDYTATQGIAMYVKFPEGGLQSSLAIRLIKKDWSEWFTLGDTGNVTLIDNDGNVQSHAQNISETLSGYEGFLFIPYTSMTNGSSPVDVTHLNATDWNVELAYYAKSEASAAADYYYDEIGYYSDMDEYIGLVKAKYSNYIADNGNTTDGIIVSGSNAECLAINSAYGKAFNIHPTAVAVEGAVSVPLNVNGKFSFDAVKGIAMYVNCPAALEKANLALKLIKRDRSEQYSISSDTEITLVSMDGIKRTVVTQPKTALAGFEGFVFIPYTAFNSGVINPAAINGADWMLEFGYRANEDADILAKYCYDEIGFYSDIEGYVALAKDNLSDFNLVFNSGIADNVTIFGGSDVTASINYKKSEYGDDINIKPSKIHGGGLAQIPAAVSDSAYDFNLTRGIAMYVRFPAESVDSGVSIRLINKAWSTWFTLGSNVPVILVSKDGVKKTVMTSPIAATLAGYEGFVFIPYSSLTEGSQKVDKGLINGTDWNVEIGYYAGTEESVSANYYYDEVGYYSDVEGYIDAAYADWGKTNDPDAGGPVDPDDELAKGNYIANHGNSLDDVWNNGSMVMSEDEVLSPYGSSVAMLPNEVTPPVNTFGGYYIPMPKDTTISKAKGVAFYVNFPDGGTQTQCQLLLQADNETYWVAEDNTYCVMYDMDGNRVEQTMWYPMADLQGFEGYMFVPFSSFHFGGAGGAAGVDVSLLQNKAVSLRFGHYRWNENELNLKYVVDELGYYGDEDGYLKLLKGQLKAGNSDVSGNYLLNNCDQESKVVISDASQVGVKEKDGIGDTRYSLALYANTVKASKSYVNFKTNITNQDFSKANGLAMYVKFPQDAIQTNSVIMLSANNDNYYIVKDNPTYCLVDRDGKVEQTSPPFSLHDLQGYEGYIFIPFDQFVNKANNALDKSALNHQKFTVSISQYRDNSDDLGKEYIFDSIGCYESIDGYKKMISENNDPVKSSEGDYLHKNYDSFDGEYTIYPDITFKKVDDVSSMGSAVSVTPTKVGSTVWFVSPFSKNESKWSQSNGLCFYADIPNGVRDSSSEIFLVNTDEDFWKVKSGAAITLINIYGEASTSVSSGLPLQNLGGYRGWVFIPFDQFVNGMGYSGTLDEQIDNYSQLQFRTGYTKTYGTDINVEYVYDSVGFYRTTGSFLTMMDFKYQDKPADLSYYNKYTDSKGYYLVNNIKDMGATVSGTYGIAAEAAGDNHGMKFHVNGAFSAYLNNFRRGEDVLAKTQGICIYIKDLSMLSNLSFEVGIIDDSNMKAVEKYSFDSAVSEFYYSIGDRLYIMSAADLKLTDHFDGYIYLPFDNFSPTDDSKPDNLKVDPDFISTIIISSEGESAFQMADISFYSTKEMLETMVGMPQSPFNVDLSAIGAGSDLVTITDKFVRLYGDLTYTQLASLLKLSSPDFNVIFTDSNGTIIQPEGQILGDFLVRIMLGNTLIREYGVTRVTNEFISPERVTVKSAVDAVLGKTIVSTKTETQEFDTMSADFDISKYFTVKQSAAKLIKFLENGKLSVTQLLSVKRLLSAFNLFNETTLRVIDANGQNIDSAGIISNGCRLIVTVAGQQILNYIICDVPNEQNQNDTDNSVNLPAPDSASISYWWIVVACAAAIVIIGGGIVATVIIIKKRRKIQQKNI